MKKIGRTLRVIRQLSGMRQGAFAKRLGVTQNYISLVENGKRAPSLKYLERFAELVDLPLAALFHSDIDTKQMTNPTAQRVAENVNQLYWEIIRARFTEQPTDIAEN